MDLDIMEMAKDAKEGNGKWNWNWRNLIYGFLVLGQLNGFHVARLGSSFCRNLNEFFLQLWKS